MTYPVDPRDEEANVVHVQDVYEEPGNLEHRTVVEDRVEVQPTTPNMLSRLIWLLLAFLEAAIGLRILLRLIAANPASPFANLIYRVTDLFLWPFAGLTATPSSGGMVLEIPSIIAMFVYALLAWGLVELIWLVFVPTRSRRRVYRRRDRTGY